MEKEIIKNRQATEMTLIKAVNDIIEESGFEGLGINAVATRAKVSKMLIYRYFNSLDGLIAAYIQQNDYWINFDEESTGHGSFSRIYQTNIQKPNHAAAGKLYVETPVSLGTDN